MPDVVHFFESLLDDDSSEAEAEKKQEQKISGITTGVVKENWDEKEKKHPGMVKVEFFLGEEGKTLTDWVRVAQPYAGNGYGSYWLPEVGDEVILAFNLGDLNKPYVIGSLWNNQDKIPEKTVTEKNTVKRIKTKGGHEIVFEEETDKGRLEIHTPKNLKITLEDEKEMITVQDEKGKNLLQIDGKNGKIAVTAEKTISFKAGDTTLELDGQGKKATLKAGTISLEAEQALQMKGQNLKAQGTLVELKGDASFKVQSSAMLELKGAMTKIN
jgi:uncharacterized protein involved in type VI secretion and phage assembly